jgi:citrate lyase subunit beta/citryl-CoA lyase
LGLLRSWMFTPGNREKMMSKAGALGADVTVIDVEDAVPPEEKAATAQKISQYYMPIRNRNPKGQIYVRINAVEKTQMSQGEKYYEFRGLEDIRNVVRPGLSGIVVPKVETAGMLYRALAAIEILEAERGMERGGVKIVALIETVQGLLNIQEISQVAKTEPRIVGFSFGGVDFSLDAGMKGASVDVEYASPRYTIALHARAAKLEHIIDSPYVQLMNVDGFRTTSQQAANLGYTGKLCIHPNQVEIANQVYMPTEAEYLHAKKTVEAFKEARKRGEGSVMFEGNIIEDPLNEIAERIIRQYESALNQ